ncbi:MAG TPA: hypothetical protein VGH60_02250 [Solirubrobacteraceae bacterium]|jgi:hypothetical protein
MSSEGLVGRRIGAVAGMALLALLGLYCLAHLVGSGARADTGGNDPQPQPVLGTASGPTVLMGAATSGEPGEAWAYRVLPLNVPPPANGNGRAQFAAPPGGESPPGQLVFERATDANPDWTVYETPLSEAQAQPYRGMSPDRPSARITPHAGGLLAGQDPTRPSGKRIVVLARDPGGRFHVLPEPSTGVLPEAGEGGDPAAGTLGEGEGAGAVADAAIESAGHTEAYFAALGRKQDTSIARWSGTQWSREPVELPSGYTGSFTIVALAGTTPQNMWLLGKASQESGLGPMLFKRVVNGSGEGRWEHVELGSALFAQAATPAQNVSDLAPLASPGQSLTVSDQGVWIDGNMQAPGGGSNGYDFTLYYDIAQAKVTTSWCDAHSGGGEALCAHPLGVRFGRLAGYRSFAFDGAGFGSRIVTNPLQPGGGDSTNMGSYLSLEGATFQRMPGAGPNDAPGGAFYTPSDGWLEGLVQITGNAQPQRLTSWPVSARAPFTGVAPAPGTTPGDPNAQALAVGAGGAVARYIPGQGWQREFLLSSSGAVSSPTLRAVAWPEANRAFAVGDLGALWVWRAETGLWEKDPAAPPEGTHADLLGIAFDPSDPALGYAVGLSGTLWSYDKTWTQDALPEPFQKELSEGLNGNPEEALKANFTSVAFAGSEAMVVAEHDLLVNSGSGWRIDPEVHALLASLSSRPQLNVIAGLPNGGAVLAGHNVVLERDGATGPWRFSEQPIVDETAVAASAYMDGSKVRAVLSVVPDFIYPPPLILPPIDPNTPPPLIPPNPLPGDGYMLRETGGGWEDEERAAYAGDSEDRPVKADPIAAFDLGPEGSGWAVGGWSGHADDAGRGTDNGGSGQAVRENVQTAGIYRYAPGGGAQSPPSAATAPVSLQANVATFALAGHAECAEHCADLADEGIAPDRNLTSALSAIDGLAGQPNGPRALLYTGGRETPGEGPESSAEANRYAQLLAQGGGLGVFPAVSAGDSEGGGAGAFGAAFAGFPAPFGEGGLPAGVSTSNIPGPSGPVRAGARTHYAFDSTGSAGTVRVIVIDNSRGSLAASDPYQNPAEPQTPWLAEMLADARARGIPAIVVGSRELNPGLPPALNVASDASEEAQIMVAGGASAYLYERPEESRASRIPAGAAVTIPELGTGALGYRSAIGGSFTPGQPDALFGATGYLLVNVNVAQRNPATNVAPVTARLIPLVQSLSLNPLDGTLLRRSAPALFEGLARRPVSGDRWGPASADGSPNPPGASPYSEFPQPLCLQSDCASAIEPEYTFTSSEPEIASFVAHDPNSTNLRKPLQDAAGHVIPDSKSGILCAFNAGNTVVTISAGGLSYSVPVTVLGGSVEQPCGTVPLAASRFAKAASTPSAGAPSPPPPAPAPAPAPIAPPPPPAAAPAPPAAKPAVKPPAAAALLFTPLLLLPQSGVPAIPPPPAGAFARPIPPGGAGVRVFEEKKEEEEATEQSQAFAAYRAADYRGLPIGARAYTAPGAGANRAPAPAVYMLLLLVLAAAGGATLRLRPKRCGRPLETAYATIGEHPASARAVGAHNQPIQRRPRRQRQ